MGSRGKATATTVKVDDELQSIVKTSVLKLCMSEEFINQFTAAIVNTITETFQTRFELLENENKELKEKLQLQEDMLNKVAEKSENLEQILRNKTIRIYGLKESKSENCTRKVLDLFSQKLGVDVQETKLEDCFRIGKYVHGKSRVIIVKFTRTDIKRAIYSNKKKLKGSGIVIREDLSKRKIGLVKLLVEKMSDADGMVWTNEGTIFAKVGDKIVKINSKQDVIKYF